MLQLNKKVRLIPMDNYCVKSYDQFYGFLQGIISRDYDVESINLLGYTEDSNATITGNGNYILVVGTNTLELIVIDPNGI